MMLNIIVSQANNNHLNLIENETSEHDLGLFHVKDNHDEPRRWRIIQIVQVKILFPVKLKSN